MLERAQTFDLDANNPNNEVLRRILRLFAIPEIIVAVVLFLTGVLSLLPFAGFLIAAIITVAIVPAALRKLPGQVTIDSAGLRISGPRTTSSTAWRDVETIEVRNASAQPGRWIFDLLRVDRNRDFVHVGLHSTRSGTPTYQRRFSLFVTDPDQFARDANDLRAQSAEETSA